MKVKERNTPKSIQTIEPLKAGIRRDKVNTNPSRRNTRLPMDSYEENIHEMNKKALRLIAKRA